MKKLLCWTAFVSGYGAIWYLAGAEETPEGIARIILLMSILTLAFAAAYPENEDVQS